MYVFVLSSDKMNLSAWFELLILDHFQANELRTLLVDIHYTKCKSLDHFVYVHHVLCITSFSSLASHTGPFLFPNGPLPLTWSQSFTFPLKCIWTPPPCSLVFVSFVKCGLGFWGVGVAVVFFWGGAGYH